MERRSNMARPGITYTDVEKACNKIIADGGRPSINGVKAMLGSGSPNNISALLKKWRAANQPEKKSDRVLPDSVILSITNEIERCVVEEKASMEQSLATLQTDQERLIQHCNDLDESIQEDQKKFTKAHTELQAAVASSQEKDKLIELLRAEIGEEKCKTENQRMIAETRHIDLAKATTRLEALEQQSVELPKLTKACTDAEKKAEASSAREIATKEAFSRLETEIGSLSEKLIKHDSEVKELQTALSESKEESSRLQVENAVMKERLIQKAEKSNLSNGQQ